MQGRAQGQAVPHAVGLGDTSEGRCLLAHGRARFRHDLRALDVGWRERRNLRWHTAVNATEFDGSAGTSRPRARRRRAEGVRLGGAHARAAEPQRCRPRNRPRLPSLGRAARFGAVGVPADGLTSTGRMLRARSGEPMKPRQERDSDRFGGGGVARRGGGPEGAGRDRAAPTQRQLSARQAI